MTGKRLIGILMILLAGIFSIGLLVQIPLLLKAFFGLLPSPDNDENAYHLGYAIGVIGTALVFIVFIALLLHYGIRWSRKQPGKI